LPFDVQREKRYWRGWVRSWLGAFALLSGAACSDEPDTSAGDAAAICEEGGRRLRECSLLTEGALDCRSMEVPGYGECAITCLRSASCEDLIGQECTEMPSAYSECLETCQNDFLRLDCQDGSDTTVHYRCDGEMDCDSGVDELDCSEPPRRFECGDGSSVRLAYRCDGGAPDCSNGADEAGCPDYAESICPG
jgi:hypothetical protein